MESPYASKAPHPQQTLDIFKGHWATKMPAKLGDVVAGDAGLFEDPRVNWCVETLRRLGRPIEGAHVVELGPLEGAHTYMIARAGAASVTAVEAHSGAFLKCLVAKELLGIERVNFLYGDANGFLREDPRHFDLGFACGFLYHMANPVETLALLAEKCRALFLWSVCWDKEFLETAGPDAGGRGPAHAAEYRGFRHTLHRHDYGSGNNLNTFWGGPASYAHWMEYDEIVGALRHFGYTEIVHEREPNRFGLAIQLLALK